MRKQLHKDSKLIEYLGGASILSKLLEVSPSRVNNWMWRGIPAEVFLDNYALFRRAERKLGLK